MDVKLPSPDFHCMDTEFEYIEEKPKSKSCFQQSWFQNKVCKSWIGYGSSDRKAFCTYCSCEMAANRGSLLRHSRNHKHRRAAVANERCLKLIDVRSHPSLGITDQDKEACYKGIDDCEIAAELEDIIAKLVGMETALLFPNHELANFVAVHAHCRSRVAPVILGDKSQILFENGDSMHELAGIRLIVRPTCQDGSFELPRLHGPNPEAEAPGLVCVESSHYRMGGTIPTVLWLNQVANFCELYNFKCHYDGTRLLHAAMAKDVSPSAFTNGFDSVTVCLVKGLGAPTGAVLAGDSQFIQIAKRIRHEMGGDISHPGMIAAIAMRNLSSYKLSLRTAHQMAVSIGQKISLIENSIFNVVVTAIATNIIRLRFDSKQTSTEMITQRLAQFQESDEEDSSILATRLDESNVILEVHSKVSNAQVELLVTKIARVLDHFHLDHL